MHKQCWATGASAIGIWGLRWWWSLWVPDVFKYIHRLQKGFLELARGQITNLAFKQFSLWAITSVQEPKALWLILPLSPFASVEDFYLIRSHLSAMYRSMPSERLWTCYFLSCSCPVRKVQGDTSHTWAVPPLVTSHPMSFQPVFFFYFFLCLASSSSPCNLLLTCSRNDPSLEHDHLRARMTATSCCPP